MSKKTDELLEQILTELKILNARYGAVTENVNKQGETAENIMNNLVKMMPEHMRQAFTGGK